MYLTPFPSRGPGVNVSHEAKGEREALPPLEARDVLRLGLDAAQALTILHHFGIVHADVRLDQV
jgi:hypothetical protein